MIRVHPCLDEARSARTAAGRRFFPNLPGIGILGKLNRAR